MIPALQHTNANETLYSNCLTRPTSLVRKTVSVWKRYLKNCTQKNDVEEIHDARLVLSLLSTNLSQFSNNERIYTVTNARRQLEGIAIAVLSTNSVELSLIATHPKNLRSFSSSRQVRGSGRALITHIVQDIFSSENFESLRVVAFSSSLGFYQKLGFKKVEKMHLCTKMQMRRSQMKKLLAGFKGS